METIDKNDIDVDAFNEAFDECYQIFLSRRIEQGNYLEQDRATLEKAFFIQIIKALRYLSNNHPTTRDNLIEIVLCGIEILSLDYSAE